MTDAPARHDAAVTDRSLLAGSAYKSGRDLAARQSLYRWQSPRYDLPGLVVEQLRHVRGTVVDVGCGNGKFIRRLRDNRPDLRLLGLDISAGILAEVPGPVAVADASRLPLPDAGANALLALHMLYHVEDIPAAVAELGRALADDGTVIASTNSARDKAELDDLWQRASGDVLGRKRGPSRISLSARFSLEEAPSLLGAAFGTVRMLELPGTITVTDPAPVIAHMASYRAWADQCGVPFDAMIQRAEEIVSQQIEKHGRFEITCLGGLLVCRR
ncbi:class I SAM-dependent methyltransferase [Streptomyces sp. UNOC14_S4]|uniref:class I SAM-dependent methyltransferase n=1 Tax=Streptomyces sp. UNOC14_S4 TaxID=2872340 RepID=UPI001E530213|nr:class I SAM-dependent methyltransferase [Streptomyces sp. UNOC14_S4]MCC3772832.1 class I SAM-dependent methyltransferase [Streptomyces sp. UNOC14_S4]